MHLNADFSKRVVVHPEDYSWVDSPSAGVERMMLDRIGGEVARATSLVRFAANATFPEHTHGAGEEFLVLEGAFGDEHELYPSGTYVRNPAGTSHSPRVGDQGCLIFVKLQQFDDSDQAQFAIDTREAAFSESPTPGIEYLQLHEHQGEHVALIRWAPDTPYTSGTSMMVARRCWSSKALTTTSSGRTRQAAGYAVHTAARTKRIQKRKAR